MFFRGFVIFFIVLLVLTILYKIVEYIALICMTVYMHAKEFAIGTGVVLSAVLLFFTAKHGGPLKAAFAAGAILMLVLVLCGVFRPRYRNYRRTPRVKSASQPNEQSASERKGSASEKSLADTLNVCAEKFGGKVLTNLYVPKKTGATTEIDAVFISKKGVFVFENKSFDGYVSGNAAEEHWTVEYKTPAGSRKAFSFYSPVFQNRTHIAMLKELMPVPVRMLSVVTFDDKTTLLCIRCDAPNVFVSPQCFVEKHFSSIWESSSDSLSEKDIEDIYLKLLPLTETPDYIKNAHIQRVRATRSLREALAR